jgi:hypothetical protein
MCERHKLTPVSEDTEFNSPMSEQLNIPTTDMLGKKNGDAQRNSQSTEGSELEDDMLEGTDQVEVDIIDPGLMESPMAYNVSTKRMSN